MAEAAIVGNRQGTHQMCPMLIGSHQMAHQVLAFHRKHLLPSLRPPIVVNEHSLERQSKHVSQSLIKSAEVRRNMRKVIEANWATTDSGNATPSFEELTERFGLIRTTVGALREVKQELGDYFNNHYGVEMLASEKKPSAEIAQLFRQV